MKKAAAAAALRVGSHDNVHTCNMPPSLPLQLSFFLVLTAVHAAVGEDA